MNTRTQGPLRVLLFNPYYPLTEMPSPPLGLAYVAAAFEQAGARVQVLDLVVNPYSRERLAALLDEFRPDLVGATCVTMSFDAAMSVLRDVRELDPRVVTAMGGPHITYCARETLDSEPALDVAVLGEGEAIVAEMVASLQAGDGVEGLKQIRGLAVRTADGSIHVSEPREHRMDVRRIAPPARHLLPLGRYHSLGLAVSMITSRGCPFQCIFCVGRKMSGAKVRYRDPVEVVDELEQLHNLGFHQINIADDLFTAKKKHCFAICDEIIARGLKVRWTAFSRANTISPELLDKLKAAGCIQLSFGFESANEDILKTVNKRIDRATMLRAVEMCQDAGMSAQASFIYGLPGETLETIGETAEFARVIDAMGTASGIHLLAPFPGTLVRDRAEEYGIKILTDDWSQYTANSAIVETPGADAALLERDVIALHEMAVAQFQEIERKVDEGTATPEEAESYNRLERMGIFYEMMMQDVFAEPLQVGDRAEEQAEANMDGLLARAEARLNYPRQRIREALAYGAEESLFEFYPGPAGIQCRWHDLTMDDVSA